jgi:hypothetical protein
VETPIADKTVALNLGDATASVFPRIYVDADVRLDAASARRVAEVLTSGEVLAAAPRLMVDTSASSWPVRAYYQVWTRMAWATQSTIGNGVFGLSAEGRSKFAAFPDVRAEDLWVYKQFADDERRLAEGATFTVSAASNLGLHLRRTARARAYNRLLDRELERLPGEAPPLGAGLIGVVRSEPGLFPSAVVYAMIAVVTHVWGALKVRRGSLAWVTDR